MVQLEDRESRRRALYAALGFCQLEEHPGDARSHGAQAMWAGVGHIVVGMERQGTR